MDTNHDQFDDVRKLLALKKYEQPPPRFFQEFSGKVIDRLHALEHARPVTWLQRLGLDLDFKPAMMGAFGVVVCGLLLVGVLVSGGSTPSPTTNFSMNGDSSVLFAPPGDAPAFASGASLNPVVNPSEIPSSTAPVSGASGSPFSLLTPHAERASFSFGSGN